MAAPMTVCLFIPQEIIPKLTLYSNAYGYLKILKNTVVVNCVTVFPCKSDDCLKKCDYQNSEMSGDHEPCLRFLGIIYSSVTEKHFNSDFHYNTASVRLKLRINELSRSFHLETINIQHTLVTDVQVVIYDGYRIAKSQILPLAKQQVSRLEDSFINFLILSCNDFMENTHREMQCRDASVYEDGLVLQWISLMFYITSSIVSKFYQCASFLLFWCPQFVTNVILWTTIGQQFYQRYLQFSDLALDHKRNKPLKVKSKNSMCAMLIDVLCGCLVMQVVLQTNLSDDLLKAAMSYTNDLVDALTNLLNWLMGAPAGLKLNIPLNNALGKFFLYHIYLWESYMTVVQPVFEFIFKMSTVISVFGLTFILSLLNDLISLATIHIYCFYGYAARLYGYQVKCLSALWRLFRGKKWNPLRQRIDSYTYDVHQLYLGTLIFTVLLFLLPTVMVYYIVFTCLRLLVLVLQGLLSRVINVFTVFPVYAVISRILNSAETAGDFYFSVFNTEGVFTLSMKISQISMKDVIQLTLPDLIKYHDLLTWKEIMSSIAWGKIIYPL